MNENLYFAAAIGLLSVCGLLKGYLAHEKAIKAANSNR
jgi:microcompartment protein CcmL/EutN